ncbi:MAG: FMN-binding glutamate synthase family protein [Thermodesulfobacteriota bacterium]|nr:MAG: FMN-binding glutamate synthase family protein [Thermodesulfobacteriota bacterium]
MGYKESSESRLYLEKLKRLGKDNGLVPYTHTPPLERIMDISSIVLIIAAIVIGIYFKSWAYFFILTAIALLIFSIRELFVQNDRTLIRIYGPLGRIRYLFEDTFRDKYLQYFNESNTNGRPIPRIVRDYIYQKAKAIKPIASFGTELDDFDFENTAQSHILHRNFPGSVKKASYEVVIGEQREGVRPFTVKNSINVSAMSYGSINWKAAECISIGAKNVAYVNTGEGGYGPHGVAGNDTVFQIGTGKFGVGKQGVLNDGTPARFLDEDLLVDLVRNNDNIRMIQVKISQGAKPGLGGVLPGIKVTPEIAAVRKVPIGKTIMSPQQHAEFIAATPEESVLKMLDFIKEVRNLTELPVGIKLCVGRLDEIDLLIEGIKEIGEGPDAIQVDGADGGTGAGENIFMNYVGFGSSFETISYLDRKLKEAGIRDDIKISGSGKLFTPAHAALAFAVGSDIVETARGVMLSLGCIQSLHCHTNECPTGITTNSKWRMHGIDIPEKSTRVHHYLEGFHDDMLHLTEILGHSDPRDITTQDIRIISHKNKFFRYFDEDPFGLYMPNANDFEDYIHD